MGVWVSMLCQRQGLNRMNTDMYYKNNVDCTITTISRKIDLWTLKD